MVWLLTRQQIGLTPDKQKVPLLCVLDPFLASNSLIVTPYVPPTHFSVLPPTYLSKHRVVVLILDNTLRVSASPRVNHVHFVLSAFPLANPQQSGSLLALLAPPALIPILQPPVSRRVGTRGSAISHR